MWIIPLNSLCPLGRVGVTVLSHWGPLAHWAPSARKLCKLSPTPRAQKPCRSPYWAPRMHNKLWVIGTQLSIAFLFYGWNRLFPSWIRHSIISLIVLSKMCQPRQTIGWTKDLWVLTLPPSAAWSTLHAVPVMAMMRGRVLKTFRNHLQPWSSPAGSSLTE
jgi:hypothetical protein